MSKTLLLGLFFALFSLATHVRAAPTTYTFTAVITDSMSGSNIIGETVAGLVVIDPSTLRANTSYYDGKIVNAYQFFYKSSQSEVYGNEADFCTECVTPQSNPPQLFGQANAGGINTVTGGGLVYDFAEISVIRDYEGQNLFAINTYSGDGVGERIINFSLSDVLGVNSNAFANVGSAADFGYGLDWRKTEGDGVISNFAVLDCSFSESTSQSCEIYGTGYLTSLRVSLASMLPEIDLLKIDRVPFVNDFSELATPFISTMDLVLEGGRLVFKMLIDYIGVGIEAARLENYERGIESFWGIERKVTIDGQVYAIDFDVEFRDATQGSAGDANATIFLNNDECRSSATTWCLVDPGMPVTDGQQMQLAAHEFGHLALGLIDEYFTDSEPPRAAKQVQRIDLPNPAVQLFGLGLEHNVCNLSTHPDKGNWCEDMMGGGLDTHEDRYWQYLEEYLISNIDRPDLEFGFFPYDPLVFDVPVEWSPTNDVEDVKSVPEPSTLLLILLGAFLTAGFTRKHYQRAN